MNQKQQPTKHNLTTFLCFSILIGIFHVNISSAQSISYLVPSSPTQQATNSTLVVIVTVTPPIIFATQYWQIRWKFDKLPDLIWFVTFDNIAHRTTTGTNTLSFSRASISASMPIGPNNQFTSSFVLRDLQLSDSGRVISIEGDAGSAATGAPTSPPLQQFTLLVKNCPSTVLPNVTVESNSYTFNTQGRFKCSNNGELFYSNGTRPSSIDTTCLASATWSGQNNLQCWKTSDSAVSTFRSHQRGKSQGTFKCSNNGELFYSNGTRPSSSFNTIPASATWSGQDNLQCWSAPNVTLGGDLTVVEGNNLTITCDYVDTTPSGSSSNFYVGDATYTRSKNEALVLSSLQQSDNNKVVSCQAVTHYTQIPANNNTGRSSHRQINILYAPQQSIQPLCTWVVDRTGSCEVKFFSNPQSEFVSLTWNGTFIVNEGSNQILSNGDMQTFTFTKQRVTYADNGDYVLMVRSSMFSSSVPLSFKINVVDGRPLPTTPSTYPPVNDNQGLIIGVSCAVAVIISVTAIIVFVCVRKKRSQKDDLDETRDNNMQLTTTDQPQYMEICDQPTGRQNLSSIVHYDSVGLAEDENGYLTVTGPYSRVPISNNTNEGNRQAAAASIPFDKYGYVDLNK